MAKKSTKGIIAGIVTFGIIGAIISPDKEIESIKLSIPDFQAEYDINTEIPIEVSISPEGANIDSLNYVVSGESVAFSENGINTGDQAGTYSLYVTSNDIESNNLSITVVDIAAREEAAAKAEEERLAKEQLEKEQLAAKELAEKEAEIERLNAELEANRMEERQETAAQFSIEPDPAPPVTESDSQIDSTVNNEANEPQTDENASAFLSSSGDNSNFNTYDNASQQQTEATYVLNTHTKKIHYPHCGSVKKIAPQNYSTSNSSIDELISQGYTTCGNCF